MAYYNCLINVFHWFTHSFSSKAHLLGILFLNHHSSVFRFIFAVFFHILQIHVLYSHNLFFTISLYKSSYNYAIMFVFLKSYYLFHSITKFFLCFYFLVLHFYFNFFYFFKILNPCDVYISTFSFRSFFIFFLPSLLQLYNFLRYFFFSFNFFF